MRQMIDDTIVLLGFGFVVGMLFALVGFRYAVLSHQLPMV